MQDSSFPATLNSAEVADGSRWRVGEGRSASVLSFQINHRLLFENSGIMNTLYYAAGEKTRLGKPWRFFQQLIFTPLWLNLVAYPLPFRKLGLALLQDYNLCLKTSTCLKKLPLETCTSDFQYQTAGKLQVEVMFSALQPQTMVDCTPLGRRYNKHVSFCHA